MKIKHFNFVLLVWMCYLPLSWNLVCQVFLGYYFFTWTCYWNTLGVLKVTVFEPSKLCESTFVPHFSWVWDGGGRVFSCVLDRLSVWAENKVLNCLNIFALYGLYLNWTKFMQKINLTNCKFYSDLKSIFICLPKNKNQPFLIGTIFK